MEKDKIKKIISLIFTFNQVTHEKFRNKDFKQSPLQIMTLKFIEIKGDPTMKDLAKFLFITPPSATSLMDNLVGRGMIERIMDEKDRRVLRLVLTEKGRRVLKVADQFIMKSIGEKFKVLNSNEQDQLIDIIEKILKNVVKLNKNSS
ncbi:MAG: MarR family winged helix-turn-helix transcriptional regulator [Minisyncoccota bacterium]